MNECRAVHSLLCRKHILDCAYLNAAYFINQHAYAKFLKLFTIDCYICCNFQLTDPFCSFIISESSLVYCVPTLATGYP